MNKCLSGISLKEGDNIKIILLIDDTPNSEDFLNYKESNNYKVFGLPMSAKYVDDIYWSHIIDTESFRYNLELLSEHSNNINKTFSSNNLLSNIGSDSVSIQHSGFSYKIKYMIVLNDFFKSMINSEIIDTPYKIADFQKYYNDIFKEFDEISKESKYRYKGSLLSENEKEERDSCYFFSGDLYGEPSIFNFSKLMFDCQRKMKYQLIDLIYFCYSYKTIYPDFKNNKRSKNSKGDDILRIIQNNNIKSYEKELCFSNYTIEEQETIDKKDLTSFLENENINFKIENIEIKINKNNPLKEYLPKNIKKLYVK